MKIIEKRFNFLRFLSEPEDLLIEKMNHYRNLSAIMFFLLAIQGACSWSWDYYIDPVGAQNTIGLRLHFLLFTILAVSFKYIKNRRVLEYTGLIAGLSGLLLFIQIMNHLDNGMIYLLSICVLFLFFPSFLYQGISLKSNIVCILSFAAFPQLVAFMGLAPGFLHPQYMILIWPAAIAMIVMSYMSAQNYRLRYESEQALKVASHTDHLTGVSNRRHFMSLLKQEILRSQRLKHPICLLMLDIDHFKNVNDTHGHLTGDVAIRAVADICRQSARQIDVVARIGGEEFAILLIEAELSGACVVAERIRQAVEKTVLRSVAGEDVSLTVSIGVAQQQLGVESEEKLIEIADKALYQAKQSGRNCVVSALSESVF